MPLGRHFLVVGAVLLALLFTADRYLDKTSSQTFGEAKFDKSIIRIRSEHKWPDKIVFDTKFTTIVPPAPVVVAPAVNKPREALAQYEPRSLKISKSTVNAKPRIAKRVRTTQFAAYPSSPERWIADR